MLTDNLISYLVVDWKTDLPSFRCEQGKLPSSLWDGCFKGCDVLLFPTVNWDGYKLVIQTDALGYSPLYYYYRNERLIVSSSIPEILHMCGPVKIDNDALSVFIRTGFFLNQDTPFQEILAFPPGGKLILLKESLKITKSQISFTPSAVNKQQAIDGYAYWAMKAIAKRLPQKQAVVSLSGGHDSRLVLLGLRELKAPIKYCVTASNNTSSEDPDTIIARMITDRLGLPHIITTPHRPWMTYDSKKNIATNFCALEHTWLMAIAEFLHTNADEVYEGTGVEVFTRTDLLSPECLNLYEKGLFPELARKIFTLWVGPPEELISILPIAASLGPFSYEVAVEKLSAALAEYHDQPNPLGSFNFWNKNRRMTALCPIRHLSSNVLLNSPLLDIDLVKFVGGIPTNLILQQEPQAACIRSCFREFSDIPFNKNLKILKPTNSKWRFPKDAIDRLLRCASRDYRWLSPILKMHLSRSYSRTDTSRTLNLICYLSQLEFIEKSINRLDQIALG